MADEVLSETDKALLIGVGIKEIDLTTTFKYYPEFGKALLENKNLLEATAGKIKDPRDRQLFFSNFFATEITNIVKSGADFKIVCTCFFNMYNKLGIVDMVGLITMLRSVKLIKSLEDLEKISNIADKAGANAKNVLGKGLLEFRYLITSMVDVELACSRFKAVADAAGKNADHIFYLSFPTVKAFIKKIDDILPVGQALIEAAKQLLVGEKLKEFVGSFLRRGKPTPLDLFQEKFKVAKPKKISPAPLRKTGT